MERNGNEINDSVSELGSLTTANLMEKVRGLQNLAYQLGLDECEYPDHIYSGLHVVYFMMSSGIIQKVSLLGVLKVRSHCNLKYATYDRVFWNKY